MTIQTLKQMIFEKKAVLAVIGLGYVGLPVACLFAQTGFTVIGVDIKEDVIQKIKSKICPIEGEEPGLAELLTKVIDSGKLIPTSDYNELTRADIIFIDVETPVDDQHIPQYKALKSACNSLAPVLKEGAMVIVESTIAPGTVNRVIRPLIEGGSGKVLNQGFYLGACPERVMPGKLLANMSGMSRVCGGSTPETSDLMIEVYRNVVMADLDPANIITAELVKTTENAYRDVQIAFANEIAIICEANDANVWLVRELVNKSPYRNMHLPGAGVGGHCIPKDPWLLAYSVDGKNVPLRLIPAARAVNDGMPLYIGKIIDEVLLEFGKKLDGSRILVLGYAYLENSDDIRNSPSRDLVNWLVDKNANVIIHDPWVKEFQGNLYEKAKQCDAAVLMVAHSFYQEINLAQLKLAMRLPILLDGRNAFERSKVVEAGFYLRTLGLGRN